MDSQLKVKITFKTGYTIDVVQKPNSSKEYRSLRNPEHVLTPQEVVLEALRKLFPHRYLSGVSYFVGIQPNQGQILLNIGALNEEMAQAIVSEFKDKKIDISKLAFKENQEPEKSRLRIWIPEAQVTSRLRAFQEKPFRAFLTLADIAANITNLVALHKDEEVPLKQDKSITIGEIGDKIQDVIYEDVHDHTTSRLIGFGPSIAIMLANAHGISRKHISAIINVAEKVMERDELNVRPDFNEYTGLIIKNGVKIYVPTGELCKAWNIDFEQPKEAIMTVAQYSSDTIRRLLERKSKGNSGNDRGTSL